MESLKVHTIRRHSYGRKVRMPGDEYYMDHPKHVALFKAIKKVRRVDVEAAEAADKAKAEQLAKRRERDAKKRAETKKKRAKYENKAVWGAPENKSVKPVRNEAKKKH